MSRLTLFVKGNVDVHDSLHSCTIGGSPCWNGINEILRARYPGSLIRILHETWTRSDALLAAAGRPPATLLERNLQVGAYSVASQFSTALFETAADAIVLSLQPDITTTLVRHRFDEFLFYPDRLQSWQEVDKAWLRASFDRLAPLDVASSMDNFHMIIERIRLRSDAPILIFNLSPVVPGETIHSFQGMGETFSTRVRCFNLALTKLSETTGVSIIDVETLIARGGADALKVDAMHLMPAGYQLVAAEVARVLADYGLLTEMPEAECEQA
jgi:hypothetical protein